jgi:hypothetical protein
MKKTEPSADPQSRKIAALPEANGRERNSCIGSIGVGVRSSQTMNAATAAMPAPSATTVWSVPQPIELPRTSAHTIPSAPTVTSARPGISSAVSCPTLSPICRCERAIAANPMGTLIQKIHGHEIACTAPPPTSGPSTIPRPVIAPKIPSAFARRAGGNAALSSASASGIITAAPAPWTARAAISQPMLCASAAAAEPATNNPMPAMNIRLRPRRSPTAAPVISSTARLST